MTKTVKSSLYSAHGLTRGFEESKFGLKGNMGQKPIKYSRRDFLETIRKSAGAAAYLKYMAPLVPIIGASQSYKNDSLAAPEEPKIIFQYRTVEAIYTRNLDKIINPQSETSPILQYALYDADPQNENLDGIDEWAQGGYRVGEKFTEKISEDVYKCTLKNVFIQTGKFNEKHSCFLRDGKMWDGKTRESSYTSDGLVIPGAVDISFCAAGYTMYWRMSI